MVKPKVLQYRQGFTTNSSSSHSIVLTDDDFVESVPEPSKGDFGWDEFVLVEVQDKLRYMATMLLHQLEFDLPGPVAADLVRKYLGTDIKEFYSIDHQSRFTLPIDLDGNLHWPFFFSMLNNVVYNDNVVILGGNDNSEYNFTGNFPRTSGTLYIPSLLYRGNDIVAKWDDRDQCWVLFDKETGDKVKFTFDGGKIKTPTKSNTPEHVDIKITDFCTAGCTFCYQDSKPTGGHAERQFLRWVANILYSLDVFEVSLGGGEPLDYPHILDVLENFVDQGMVVNITTKKKDWLYDRVRAEQIFNMVGGIALSVTSGHALNEFAALLLTQFGYKYFNKISVNLIPAVLSPYQISNIFRVASHWNIRQVLLLGYKEVGRGKVLTTYNPVLNKERPQLLECINAFKNYSLASLGVDTLIVQRYKDVLDNLRIDPRRYYTEEGKFSMYIDAVAKIVAPSSYLLDKAVSIEDAYFSVTFSSAEKLLEAYSLW